MSDTNRPQHPGTYVKKHIIPKGVSVKKAAELMGIGRPALSNFLNGKANLSNNMATRLEKAFVANKQELLALQREYDSLLAQDKERRIAVKSYVPSFLEIKSTHLDAWADQIEARSALPALIRRLVHTTGKDVSASSFPAYDDSQTKGWDGSVESQSATPWIPVGKSGWEFGCNKDPGGKANSDYNNRTKDVPVEDRKNLTFVFVTPRKWHGKAAWVDKKVEESKWKDVRAFDAVDLEQWLEVSVSAQVWMGEKLGIPTDQCQSLEDYWKIWSETAKPAISPKIFNSSVSDYAHKLKDWYHAEPNSPLIVTAASKEEAKAFLYCASSSDEQIQPILDQAVFVFSPDIIKKLSGVSTQFIPIAETDEVQDAIIPLIGKRHCIVIAEGNIKTIEADISIDLPSFESFNEALKEMGFDDAQIHIYAGSTGHSPTILRRQLAQVPALALPSWAKSPEIIKKMIPMALLGTWDTRKEADKEILSYLTEKDYKDAEKDIAELASMDDAPIWSEGGFRGVVSELECINAIAGYITKEMLSDFFDMAEYILSEDDPALDLDKEDRWAANLYDKIRNHSPAIRQSICNNLIILAVHGDALFGKRLHINVEGRVSRLIGNLLRDKTPRTWLSQNSDLPLYAEAAPEEFLSTIEEELKNDEPAFRNLFEPVSSAVFSSCDRTGMLWSLELLAWDASRLSRVAVVLGKLSLYELDDNWANKPINSLKDILLIWRPHTAATTDERCDVLELLCKECPEIGWKLCIQNLDRGRGFTSGTYKPSWRSDASGFGHNTTYSEARKYALKCIELVLSWPCHTVHTLKDLVDCMHSFEVDEKELVLGKVRNWVESSPSEMDIIELREHVRIRTMTSRAIRRIKNNGKEDNYVSGKELYELLEPKDIVLKHLWLFSKSWVEFTPEELSEDNLDHQARERGLEKQRKDALVDIVSEKDQLGVFDLLEKSNAGVHIGHALFNGVLRPEEIENFILECLSKESTEVDSCLSGILHQYDDEDRKDVLLKLSNNINFSGTICRLLLVCPFSMSTWSFLEEQELNIKDLYWRKASPRWCNDEEISYPVGELIKIKRPRAAFQLAHYKIDKLDSNTIIELMKQVGTLDLEGDANYRASQYDIEQALEVLNSRNDFDIGELVNLEYLYIDALHLDSSYGIPNLSKAIAESPIFFMQLVAYGFKSHGGKPEPEEWRMPQDNKSISVAGTKSYNVLNTLSVIPGTQEDEKIDAKILLGWVKEVRRLAKEYGREVITDQMIGKLMSTCGSDEDGVWPRKEIRCVFEEIASEDISTGMQLGLYNSTGAEFHAVDSSRERSRVENYSGMASKIMNKYPFTAKMLRDIAHMYERDAEHWDEDARVNKRLRGW